MRALDLVTGSDRSADVLEGHACRLEGERGSLASFVVKGGSPGATYAISVLADLTTGDRLEERLELAVDPSPFAKMDPLKIVQQPRTPETGDREMCGRFTYPGAGVPNSQRRLNATGRGKGDRRRIAVKALDLDDDAPPVWPHEVDEAGAEKKSLPVSKIVMTRGHLIRGRIARAEDVVRDGLRNEKRDDQDDLKPILVVPHPDGSDRYAVVRGRGEHRVAAAHLANPKGDVPVVVGKCATCAAKQLDSTPGHGAEWRPPGGVDDDKARADREKKRQREMDRLARLIGQGLKAAQKPSRRGSRILPKIRQSARRAGGGTPEMQTKIREIHDSFAATGESYGTTRTTRMKKMDHGNRYRDLGSDAKREAGKGKNPPSWAVDEATWEKATAAASKTYDENDTAFWPALVLIYENMGGKINGKTKKSDDDGGEGDAVKIEKREMGLSTSELRSKLSEAVRAKVGAGAYIVEIYPDTQYVVAEKRAGYDGIPLDSSNKLCRIEYEIGDDDEVTLGDPENVELDYVPMEKGDGDDDVKTATRIVEKAYVAVADPRLDGDMTHAIRGLEPGEALALQKALVGSVMSRSRISQDETDLFFEASSEDARGKSILVKTSMTVEEEVPAEDEGDAQVGDVPILKSGGEFLSGTDALAKAAKKGLLTAIVYSPSDPERPEPDLQGEWATAEDIEEAAHNYLAKTGGRIKIQHGKSAPNERVVESWIQPNDWQVGKKLVKAGTWLMTIKLSEETKKAFEAGKLRGLSMGGTATRV